MGKGRQPLPTTAGWSRGMGFLHGAVSAAQPRGVVATVRSRCAAPAKGNAPVVVIGNTLPVGFVAVLLSLTPSDQVGGEFTTRILLFTGGGPFFFCTTYKRFEWWWHQGLSPRAFAELLGHHRLTAGCGM